MVVYAERNVAQTQDDQARGNVLGRVQVGTVYTEYILDHKAYHLLRWILHARRRVGDAFAPPFSPSTDHQSYQSDSNV